MSGNGLGRRSKSSIEIRPSQIAFESSDPIRVCDGDLVARFSMLVQCGGDLFEIGVLTVHFAG